ncbi:MAG: dicarboxylate/amino acid:cation symporter [Endomicrobium sp.]|jgi:Na+/H+-dicarboxylate symporter|nr:dicarboxylate/amino acid:cation symporter [Endomicrobium sp.]
MGQRFMPKIYSNKVIRSIWFYLIAIFLGIVCGMSGMALLEQVGQYCAEIFSRILKFISVPIVSLSVIVALSSYDSDKSMIKVIKKSWFYTITTTICAASIAALLYLIVRPNNLMAVSELNVQNVMPSGTYSKYLLGVIPDNILKSFLENNILSVLLISAIIGISIRFISEPVAKNIVISFFKGFQSIFFTITRFIMKIMPVGLFGFAVVSVLEFKNGLNIVGLGEYLFIVLSANAVQGIIILPLWLAYKKINPFKAFKAMSPALSVAFFSKSSSATLPVTMDTIEKNLNVSPKIGRFVLPLCTAINMNGCAAFIFTTCTYMLQNNGVEINFLTIVSWVFIATLAAIGNAGIPMGCFFMSVSLMSAMNVPISLMGIILPFYNLIDMEETALNVWSDSCVTMLVDKET